MRTRCLVLGVSAMVTESVEELDEEETMFPSDYHHSAAGIR